jgi:HK97 gp10 family phage protein
MRTRTFTGDATHGIDLFVTHLMRVERNLHIHNEVGLEGAARLLVRDAKEQIGHYQPQVGPFASWAPLSPGYEADKVAAGGKAGAPLLMTGQMRDSISHEVHGSEAVVGATDKKMVYHEFGTSSMPARPVFGPAVYKNRKAIEQLIGRALLSGLLDGEAVPDGGYFGGHIG